MLYLRFRGSGLLVFLYIYTFSVVGCFISVMLYSELPVLCICINDSYVVSVMSSSIICSLILMIFRQPGLSMQFVQLIV